MGAQQEDVTRHRFGGPVLVDRADEGLVGFEHYSVVAQFGDGATRGERRQACPLAPTELPVDRVVVDVGGSGAPAGENALADQFDNLVEGLPGQVAVVVRPTDQLEEIVGAPLLGGGLGHDLLGEDVEGCLGWMHRVETTGTYGGQQCR